MKRLNGAGTRALATVREFTVAQRTIALIGVAVLLLGGFALASQLSKPTYSPLYSNLPAADASAVVAQLTKDKVQYQLLDGGNTILVPEASVDAERLATASMLSSGSGGYSLLDDMGVTASQFQQDVTYKRAIEGELAKTIQSIQGVSGASVMLAIPQQTVFTDEKQSPTASVVVNTGQTLTSDQVGAIVGLVAASYPGLTTSNVSVVDQKGDLLSAVGGGATGSSSAQASTYEAATRASVQSMLDKVLGPGNATVSVAADVSRSSGTKKTEQYTTPTQAPVLSESTNDQSYSGNGAGTAASGVLGNDTTSTSTTGSGGGSGNGSFKSTQGVKNNAVDKTTTDETIVPGTLNRQTIAVAVNSAVTGVSPTVIQQLVTQAAGVNTARGDAVTVQVVPFSNAAAKQAAAALAQSQKDAGSAQMMQLITTAVQVVGGLLFFVLALVLLKKLFKRPEPTVVDGGVLGVVPGGVPGAMGGDPMLAGAGMPGQLGGYAGAPAAFGLPSSAAPTQVMATAGGDPAYLQMQADVDALAGADPEQTAEYLRALMGDRTKA